MQIKGQYLLGLCLLLAVGCDDNEADKAKKAPAATAAAQDQAEQQLIADPARALPELRRRLRSTVKFNDGLIVVDSPFGMGTLVDPMPFLSLFVLPANAPWVIRCGLGMTVTFGNSAHDDASHIQVALTLESIDKSGCETLGPAVGQEIRALLAGR